MVLCYRRGTWNENYSIMQSVILYCKVTLKKSKPSKTLPGCNAVHKWRVLFQSVLSICKLFFFNKDFFFPKMTFWFQF